MNDLIKIELTKEEHSLITGILMMHHLGMVLEVKNPLIHNLAQRFSLRDIRGGLKSENFNVTPESSPKDFDKFLVDRIEVKESQK